MTKQELQELALLLNSGMDTIKAALQLIENDLSESPRCDLHQCANLATQFTKCFYNPTYKPDHPRFDARCADHAHDSTEMFPVIGVSEDEYIQAKLNK